MIRLRDSDTCQSCGNVGHTNAHHIVTRSQKALRFEPMNGVALCFACHTASHKFSAHKTPEAFRRWFKKTFPERDRFLKRHAADHMSEREAVKTFQKLIEAA